MRAVRRDALALCLAALFASSARADNALALQDLAGRPVALAPTADRALVIHFWATWCPSCKDELGDLDAAVRACGNVEVVAVNVAEDPQDVAKWLAERPLAMRVLIDPDGDAWRASGGREMPANAIWANGQRTWSFGPSSVAVWRERLAALGCRIASTDVAPRQNTAAPPPDTVACVPRRLHRDGRVGERWLEVPAVGRSGGAPLPGFLE